MKFPALLFLPILILLLTLSSIYLGKRLATEFPWARRHRKLVTGSVLLFIALQLIGPLVYRFHPALNKNLMLLQIASYGMLGIFSVIIFYLIIVDVGLRLRQLIRRKAIEPDLERRALLAVGVATLGSSVAGFAQAISGPRVYEVELPLANLPPEFEGFRIVQITDLHVGPTIGRGYVQAVADIVQGLNPDLVAYTGDMVDGFPEYLRFDLEPLISIRPPHGAFFITGNHEYYWGVEPWLEEMARMGARVLVNEHVIIAKDGAQLVLAGVSDLRGGQFRADHVSDPHKAIAGAPPDLVRILLAHQPGSYDAAHEAGFHVQLSGHTHGGQFFPWSLLVGLVHRYYKGLYDHKGMWVYVSRGTGYWGPPMRFSVPAEVTLLRLTRRL